MERIRQDRQEEINRRAQARRAAVLAPKLVGQGLENAYRLAPGPERDRAIGKVRAQAKQLFPGTDVGPVFDAWNQRGADQGKAWGDLSKDLEWQQQVALGASPEELEKFARDPQVMKRAAARRETRLVNEAAARMPGIIRWMQQHKPRELQNLRAPYDFQDVARINRMVPDTDEKGAPLKLTPDQLRLIQTESGEVLFSSGFREGSYQTQAQRRAEEAESRTLRRQPFDRWRSPGGAEVSVQRGSGEEKELADAGWNRIGVPTRTTQTNIDLSSTRRNQLQEGLHDIDKSVLALLSLDEAVSNAGTAGMGALGGLRGTVQNVMATASGWADFLNDTQALMMQDAREGRIFDEQGKPLPAIEAMEKMKGIGFDPSIPALQALGPRTAYLVVRALTAGRVPLEGQKIIAKSLGIKGMFANEEAAHAAIGAQLAQMKLLRERTVAELQGEVDLAKAAGIEVPEHILPPELQRQSSRPEQKQETDHRVDFVNDRLRKAKGLELQQMTDRILEIADEIKQQNSGISAMDLRREAARVFYEELQ